MATPWRSRLLVRTAMSFGLAAALVVAGGLPGFAQPGAVPDPGARPAPAGQLPLPNGSFARPPAVSESLVGPLSAEIAAIDIQISTLTAELQTVQPAIGPAEAEAGRAEQEWRAASEQLTDAQQALDELVGDSYRGAAALPADLYIPELRGLSAHAPVLPVEAPLGAAAAARELVAAQLAEQEAVERYRLAQQDEQDLRQRREELEADLSVLRPRRERLLERNAELLAEAERAREAAAQELDFPVQEPVAGFRAGPDAVRAVEFALRQLGKPYEWGAEGPDRFDCSGLMWAAYRSVGRTLPRVAADQFQGTRLRLVARTAAVAQLGLLPGDLVFFSTGPAWQSVHHVGMYVGNGYMVHAPNRNEVVKVSPVWWSRFFAATRVVDAVPVEESSEPPLPAPRPRPTLPGPVNPGPVNPGPSDPGTDPEPTDPGPEETTPPEPEPSDSPSPEPSDSPTPEPEESSSPEPEDSPSPEPEESPSPEPEESPSPSPEASPSASPSNATASPSPTPS
jgi:cell wall-associated NlpC family hydrolase